MAYGKESSTFLGGSVDGSVSESSIVVGESFAAFSKKMNILKAVRQHGASDGPEDLIFISGSTPE